MEPITNFNKIGLELLQHSHKAATFTAQRGLVDELFPYIYGASKRMSTRAISKWLEEAKGVKLSAVTIAKALRDQDRHWATLCDEIEVSARVMAMECKTSVWELLSMDPDDFARDCANNPHVFSPTCQEEADIASAAEELSSRWFSIVDEAALKRCRDFIMDSPDEHDAE